MNGDMRVRFDDVPVVPLSVSYAPTRNGKPRWAVYAVPLKANVHTQEALFRTHPWHVWDNDLALHFAQRIGFVVTCGGMVRVKNETTWSPSRRPGCWNRCRRPTSTKPATWKRRCERDAPVQCPWAERWAYAVSAEPQQTSQERLRQMALERLGPDGKFTGTDRYHHGTASSYRFGCRCAVCREAWATKQREYRVRSGRTTADQGPKPERTKAVKGEDGAARHGAATATTSSAADANAAAKRTPDTYRRDAHARRHVGQANRRRTVRHLRRRTNGHRSRYRRCASTRCERTCSRDGEPALRCAAWRHSSRGG